MMPRAKIYPGVNNMELPFLADKTALITGVNGFLGLHTSVAAVKSGANVVGIDSLGSSVREKVRYDMGVSDIPIYRYDLSNYESWRNILKKSSPDIIFHLAGSTNRGLTPEDWSNNIKGNLFTTTSMIQSILDLSEDLRPAVIYSGSPMEYGRSPMPWTEETLCQPHNFYGASKLASTEIFLSIARSNSFKSCVVRMPIIYGPAQKPNMFIPELICTLLSRSIFEMTTGTQKRKFLYATDAALFLLRAGEMLLKKEALPILINMPACDAISLREVAKQVASLTGGEDLVRFGNVPMRDHESLACWLDDSQSRSLGFSCSGTLEKYLEKTVKWYKNNRHFWKNML